MPFVMKADASSADAYAQFDFPSDEPEVWLTLSCFWDSVAQAVWALEEFSGDISRIRCHTDGGGSTNANGASIGVDAGTVKWYQDRAGSHFGPVAVNDVTYLVELYYKQDTPDGTTEMYVDGTLIQSVLVDGSTFLDAYRIFVGQSNGAPNDPGTIVYVDDVKVGTTRGGSEIFTDDFEDGTFDAWTSTTGDVSLVGSGSPERRIQLGMQHPIVKRRTSVYFDNVKVGSTLGGSDYIDNDFESGF
jgi:hypothetical protein